jgi:hypothetical protein
MLQPVLTIHATTEAFDILASLSHGYICQTDHATEVINVLCDLCVCVVEPFSNTLHVPLEGCSLCWTSLSARRVMHGRCN